MNRALSPTFERLAWPAVAVVSALAAADLSTHAIGVRLGLAVVACLLLGALAFFVPRRLMLVLIVWLTALGLVRRLLNEAGSATKTDPLLLVAPFALALLAAIALRQRTLATRSGLATAIGLLSVLVVLGAFTPGQGGLAVGVSGLLFLLVPMLAFWIGRDLCDDTLLRQLLKLIGCLAVPAAVYGLIQNFAGFPSWDLAWIANNGYAALSVGGVIRAFGSFSSAAEYADYLAIGTIVWLAFWFRGSRFPVAVVALTTLVTALVLESSRAIFFVLLFAAGVVFAAWRRFPIGFSLVAGLAATVLLVFGASRIAPHPSTTQTGTANLVSHQLQGLANPLDPQSSTLLLHLNLVTNGLESALSHPIGRGIGVVTRAGQKFGSTETSTESDPSNIAIALGVPGLLVYLVVFFLGFRTVYRVAVVRRSPLAIAALAVTALTAFNWLTGGEYAIAPLPWLVMGWADGWMERNAASGASADPSPDPGLEASS